MKKQLLLTRMLLLVALLVGSVSAWGESYTITFKKNSGDGTSASTSTACSTIVSDGATYLSGNLVTATKVYYNGSDGLKLGASSNPGIIKMNLASNVKPTSIVVNAKRYNSSKAVTIAVNGKTAQSLTAAFANYTFTFDGDTQISFIQLNSSKYCWVSSITVNYSAAGTTAPPTITGDATFLGTTTVTITNAASADGADIFYTLNGDDPTTTTSANCFAYSDAFEISSTTTVKAIAKKSTDPNASSVVSKTFTKVTPMTVTAALTAIADLADNGTIADQCVTGIVSTAGTLDNGAITYSVSVDGTTTNELQVYKGKGLNGDNFENASDIAVGDIVVIYGTLKNYNGTTPEFDQGSYLLSKVRKPAPTFSLNITEKTLAAYGHETVDVTLDTNTDGEITCESDDADVATVALKSGKVYTITAQSEGTATITIRSAASANYAPASATVAITVTDTRADAEISFENDAVETTWGEEFTGQVLTNTNSVAVTWSSTDETVATVNSTGVVNVLKAGSTTIKATFDGDATYKAAVASYTLTVNKADAGLSFDETAFDVDLNDDSFVAPTLNNPNSLTVTYASSDEDIAHVDENDGTLVLETSAEGTVTITASFAGNDNFKAGNAQYTITITDPTKKGTKKNPYTVAEVIDGTATGNGIYVRGFIVGYFNGKDSDATTTGTSGTVSNVALSDDPSEISGENTIAVQLPNSSTVRTNWNIYNNAVIGYKVLVQGDITSYFTNKTGVKNTSEITAVSVPVTVSAAKYATFASDYDLDFPSVESEGLYAYTATVAGKELTFTKVTGSTAVGEGLLLYSETAKTYNVPVATDSPEKVSENKLVRGTGAAVASDGEGETKNYVLSMNGAGDVNFYLANGNTVPTSKAYLKNIPTTTTSKFFLPTGEDDTDGIKSVQGSRFTVNGEAYNLAGQKVGADYKGIVIVNGKKVIIK